MGVIPTTIDEYFNWSGRWASSGLTYFVTSSFDIVRLYPLLLAIYFALLAVSVFWLLQAAEIGVTIRQRLALTAAGLALYWAGMPHPGENIYWLTGSSDNLVGVALSLLLFAGLLQRRPRSVFLSITVGIGLSLLALVATGFHELFGLLLCIALGGGTLKMLLARDRHCWMWMASFVAALIGFLVVYAAPGNAVRQAEFPLAGHLGLALRLTVKQTVSNVVPWILDLRLLSATALLLMLMPGVVSWRRRFCPVPTARDTIIVAVTWIVAICAAFAAVSWATGSNLILRTLDGIYLVFMTGWFWILVMVTRQFAERGEPLVVATPLMRRVLVVIFVCALLLTGNTWKALPDLYGTAPAYARAMHGRWRTLDAARARSQQDAFVEPIKVHPQSYINYFELRDDPNYWENTSVARYFGLRTVRLASKISQTPTPSVNR